MADQILAGVVTGGLLMAMLAWAPLLDAWAWSLRRRRFRREVDLELEEWMRSRYVPARRHKLRDEVLP